jgi:tRNA (guanine-N7-)-methyltransferase
MTALKPSSYNPAPGYILYGRRKGKKLRAGKTALMENLLPRLIVPEGNAPLDPEKLFPDKKDVWLEVGFGSGEHLAGQAKMHPDIGFIGCEPFINGIAGLLGLIDADHITNIRIRPEDARPMLDRLPDNSLGRAFVLFGDPWPKKRHAERRFIGPVNLEKLARVMKPSAELRVASDEPTLQEWTKEQLFGHAAFKPAPGVLEKRPADWHPTRYEEKALKAGRRPIYFLFQKI